MIYLAGSAVLWAVALCNVVAFDLLATHPLIDVRSDCFLTVIPFSYSQSTFHLQSDSLAFGLPPPARSSI
jgi:hypothetical protein